MVVVGIVLFWVILLAIQVAIYIYLIRTKAPEGLSGRGSFYRLAAIVVGFLPLTLMALAAQLVYHGLYRTQVRKLLGAATS